MSLQEWFGAKTVYKHNRVEGKDAVPKVVYEERVVLFQAANFDEAIAKAEAEAQEYSDNGTTYLGYVNVFHLFDQTVGEGTEVYSLMRESTLPEQEYINHFYDTGKERTQTWTEGA